MNETPKRMVIIGANAAGVDAAVAARKTDRQCSARYAPSVCETWEPMVLAVTMAIRKL